jgi:hypothetical protein
MNSGKKKKKINHANKKIGKENKHILKKKVIERPTFSLPRWAVGEVLLVQVRRSNVGREKKRKRRKEKKIFVPIGRLTRVTAAQL